MGTPFRRRTAARFLVAAMFVLPATGCGYNRIQALDETAEQQESNIGVVLTKRNQLVPNLVATVEGAANFERGTFTEVARARAGVQEAREQVSQAVQGGDVEQISAADAALTRQIGTYLNIAVEAYPQLTATQNFRMLQDELSSVETEIAVARRDYNTAVRDYNSYIRQFPQVVTARATGAERRDSYQTPAGATEPPVVEFGT
jgi:LemA protein